MKKLFAIATLALLLTACSKDVFSQQILQAEILTNYSIINMVKKGLSANIVLLKIKQSNVNFDVTTDALVFLKESKVSDDIILSMVEKSTQNLNNNINSTQSNNQNNIAQSSNNNNQSISSQVNNNIGGKKVSPQVQGIIENLNGSGIYYYDEELKTYTQVDPTVVSGTQNKANAGAYFGVGGSSVSKSFIDGKEANIQINHTRRPIFYFYFDSISTSLNNSNNKTGQTANNYMDVIYGYGNQMNSKAFSPNDFKLIQLDNNRNSRYFKGGKEGLGGSSSRISSNYFKTFKYERLSSTLFKVYFIDDLDKIGQFCFLYAGNTSNNNVVYGNTKTEIKVFDFGTYWKKKR